VPLTVLYVSDSPTLSGAEVVLLGHVKAFRPPAFRTHVLLRASNTRLQAALDEVGVTYTASANFSDRVVKTTIDPGDLAHFARAFLRVRREIIDLIARTSTDVVHSISYPAPLYAALACRRTGVAHVWHEHNVKRLHAFNKPIYRFAAATCCRVIGPSQAVVQALAQAGFDPALLQTVYNGIDLCRFDPTPQDVARAAASIAAGEVAIGLFGQMLPHKGHHVLIEAAPAVLDRCPSARFFFVGALENPPYQDELRRAIAARGLGDRFSFTGWRGDVPALLKAMTVVVVPTLTPEPAALSLMETMAVGRPVVGSRTGGTPELIEDGRSGLLVPPGDPAALAGAVTRLVTDPELAARIGAAGRDRVQRLFSIERHVEQVRTIYERCCARRH
jgi:glycosyltransferase involved in cell wall biosynthesis